MDEEFFIFVVLFRWLWKAVKYLSSVAEAPFFILGSSSKDFLTRDKDREAPFFSVAIDWLFKGILSVIVILMFFLPHLALLFVSEDQVVAYAIVLVAFEIFAALCFLDINENVIEKYEGIVGSAFSAFLYFVLGTFITVEFVAITVTLIRLLKTLEGFRMKKKSRTEVVWDNANMIIVDWILLIMLIVNVPRWYRISKKWKRDYSSYQQKCELRTENRYLVFIEFFETILDIVPVLLSPILVVVIYRGYKVHKALLDETGESSITMRHIKLLMSSEMNKIRGHLFVNELQALIDIPFIVLGVVGAIVFFWRDYKSLMDYKRTGNNYLRAIAFFHVVHSIMDLVAGPMAAAVYVLAIHSKRMVRDLKEYNDDRVSGPPDYGRFYHVIPLKYFILTLYDIPYVAMALVVSPYLPRSIPMWARINQEKTANENRKIIVQAVVMFIFDIVFLPVFLIVYVNFPNWKYLIKCLKAAYKYNSLGDDTDVKELGVRTLRIHIMGWYIFLLYQLFLFILDIPTFLLYLLVKFSFVRSKHLDNVYDSSLYSPAERRKIILVQSFLLAMDLVIVMMVIVLLLSWRIYEIAKIFSRNFGEDRRYYIYSQFGELLKDIPAIAMSALTLWRFPVLVHRVFWRHSTGKERRREVFIQFWNLILDIPTLICLAIIHATFWRIWDFWGGYWHRVRRSKREHKRIMGEEDVEEGEEKEESRSFESISGENDVDIELRQSDLTSEPASTSEVSEGPVQVVDEKVLERDLERKTSFRNYVFASAGESTKDIPFFVPALVVIASFWRWPLAYTKLKNSSGPWSSRFIILGESLRAFWDILTLAFLIGSVPIFWRWHILWKLVSHHKEHYKSVRASLPKGKKVVEALNDTEARIRLAIMLNGFYSVTDVVTIVFVILKFLTVYRNIEFIKIIRKMRKNIANSNYHVDFLRFAYTNMPGDRMYVFRPPEETYDVSTLVVEESSKKSSSSSIDSEDSPASVTKDLDEVLDAYEAKAASIQKYPKSNITHFSKVAYVSPFFRVMELGALTEEDAFEMARALDDTVKKPIIPLFSVESKVFLNKLYVRGRKVFDQFRVISNFVEGGTIIKIPLFSLVFDLPDFFMEVEKFNALVSSGHIKLEKPGDVLNTVDGFVAYLMYLSVVNKPKLLKFYESVNVEDPNYWSDYGFVLSQDVDPLLRFTADEFRKIITKGDPTRSAMLNDAVEILDSLPFKRQQVETLPTKFVVVGLWFSQSAMKEYFKEKEPEARPAVRVPRESVKGQKIPLNFSQMTSLPDLINHGGGADMTLSSEYLDDFCGTYSYAGQLIRTPFVKLMSGGILDEYEFRRRVLTVGSKISFLQVTGHGPDGQLYPLDVRKALMKRIMTETAREKIEAVRSFWDSEKERVDFQKLIRFPRDGSHRESVYLSIMLFLPTRSPEEAEVFFDLTSAAYLLLRDESTELACSQMIHILKSKNYGKRLREKYVPRFYYIKYLMEGRDTVAFRLHLSKAAKYEGYDYVYENERELYREHLASKYLRDGKDFQEAQDELFFGDSPKLLPTVFIYLAVTEFFIGLKYVFTVAIFWPVVLSLYVWAWFWRTFGGWMFLPYRRDYRGKFKMALSSPILYFSSPHRHAYLSFFSEAVLRYELQEDWKYFVISMFMLSLLQIYSLAMYPFAFIMFAVGNVATLFNSLYWKPFRNKVLQSAGSAPFYIVIYNQLVMLLSIASLALYFYAPFYAIEYVSESVFEMSSKVKWTVYILVVLPAAFFETRMSRHLNPLYTPFYSLVHLFVLLWDLVEHVEMLHEYYVKFIGCTIHVIYILFHRIPLINIAAGLLTVVLVFIWATAPALIVVAVATYTDQPYWYILMVVAFPVSVFYLFTGLFDHISDNAKRDPECNREIVVSDFRFGLTAYKTVLNSIGHHPVYMKNSSGEGVRVFNPYSYSEILDLDSVPSAVAAEGVSLNILDQYFKRGELYAIHHGLRRIG